MNNRIKDLFAGREARDTALSLLNMTRGDYIERAREVAVRIARERGEVTSDDVMRELPVPEGMDPRVLGAVFRVGTLVKTGRYRQTTQRQAHARPISIWVLRKGVLS